MGGRTAKGGRLASRGARKSSGAGAGGTPRILGDLRLGDHLCIIYRNDEEHRAILSEYMSQGLRLGQRMVYIVDARTARTLRGYLRGAEVDVPAAEERGQLVFLTRDDAYMRGGEFDPQGMIRLLREETQRALDEGYEGLRVTGEMTWALRGLPGSERLMEYEALLNEFFPGSKATALCQYDARHFPAEVLLDVLRTHPIAVVGTKVYDNFYYVPPEEMLAGKSAAATLERWVGSLEENRRLTESLREHTRALEERLKELECLREVRELTAREELPVPELMQAALEPIRRGWRWPEWVQVRIGLGEWHYQTAGYQETPHRITAEIRRQDEPVGTLEVSYPEPAPAAEPFLSEERALLGALATRLGQALTSRWQDERILHLNSVLKAIRNVNQLIVREREEGALIRGACAMLAEARGFSFAWIVLLDEGGRPARWDGSGVDEELAQLVSAWSEGKLPLCAERALGNAPPAVIDDLSRDGGGCPVAAGHPGEAGMAAAIRHEGRAYGVMAVGLPPGYASDPEEQALMAEVAGDLGYAIAGIRAEAARRETERQLGQLMANLPGMAYRCRVDRDWTMEFLSEGCRELLGYAPEAVVGSRVVAYGELVHPDDRERIWDEVQQAVAQQELFTLTYRVRTRAGEEKWVWEQGGAVLQDTGEVVLEGFITDVTDTVRAQDALRESEEHYRTLFERTTNPILVIDVEGNYLDGNEAALWFLECTREELIGRNVADMLPPGVDSDVVMRAHRELWKRGGRIETDHYVNGVLKTLDLTITPGSRQGRPVIWGVGTDITERKQADASLRASKERYRQLFSGVVLSLARLSEMRDPYTAGHQQRVAELAGAIAARMGLADERVEALRIAALLHDIGKSSVPAEILNKPTKLSELEFSIVKGHVQASYDILERIPFESPVAEVVLQHHERLDGSGYPQGLEGEEILFEARILTVADVVEAMASHRPYRPALGVDEALGEILTHRGRLYDPDVVKACVALFEEGFEIPRAG